VLSGEVECLLVASLAADTLRKYPGEFVVVRVENVTARLTKGDYR